MNLRMRLTLQFDGQSCNRDGRMELFHDRLFEELSSNMFFYEFLMTEGCFSFLHNTILL